MEELVLGAVREAPHLVALGALAVWLYRRDKKNHHNPSVHTMLDKMSSSLTRIETRQETTIRTLERILDKVGGP